MKKWMAMLLTLCMLLSLMPATALAMELTLDQPVAVVEEPAAQEEPAEEEPAEEPAENPVEEPAEEPVEEPAEEPAEEPVEEPAAETGLETGEDNAEMGDAAPPWGGGNQNDGYVLDQTYWNSSAYVGWTGMNASSNYTYNKNLIQSVTLGGQTIKYYGSTTSAPTGSSLANDTAGRVRLSACYPGVNQNNPGVATLTVTPVAGYYVSRVVVACCSPSSPFDCGTWNANAAYDAVFTELSGTSLSVALDSENFGHYSRDGEYFLVIEVKPIPNSLYVQYAPGTAGTTALSSLTAYAGSDWMVENAANSAVNQPAGLEYLYTKTSVGNYDPHTANDVAANLKTVTVGGKTYVFDGWKVEYYAATANQTQTLYTQNFSNHQWGYDSTVASGAQVTLLTHVKLIAQWKEQETPPVGSLTITKSFNEGFDTSRIPEDLTFRVVNEDTGAIWWIDYADFTNGSYTLQNLTPGNYNIQENNAYLEGYSHSQVITVGQSSTALDNLDFTLAVGATTTVAIANTYTQNTGSLILRKHFLGDELDAPENLSFTIDGPDGFNDGQNMTIPYSDFTVNTHHAGGWYELTGIPVGEYTVTENNAAVDGYSLSTTYKVDNTAADAAGLTLTTGVHEVLFENTYTREKGSLTITKTVTGGLSALPAGVDPTFTITGPDNYSATVKYSQFTNGHFTINNLPTGTYTVAETGADVTNYDLDTSYSVTGGAVAVAAGQVSSLTVTNDYTIKTGDLTIVKEFKGLETGELPTDTFTIHLWEGALGSRGVARTLTIETPANIQEIKDGGNVVGYSYSWTVEDLPYGNYTIEERGYDVEHHNLESASIDGVAVEDLTEVYAAYSFTGDDTVTVVNTYGDQPIHILNIPFTKIVEVADGSPIAGEYEFRFKLDMPGNWTAGGGVDDHWVFYTGDLLKVPGDDLENFYVVVSAEDVDANGKATVSGHIRLLGTEDDFRRLIQQIIANNNDLITVTEIDDGLAGWTYDSSAWDIGFVMVDKDTNPTDGVQDWHPDYILYEDGTEITNEDDEVISFTNGYDWEYGTVTVTKEVLGRTDDDTPYEFDMTIIRPENSQEVLFGQRNNGSGWENFTGNAEASEFYYGFELADGESVQVRIPAGWSYTLEEVLPADATFDMHYEVNDNRVTNVAGTVAEGGTTEVVVYNDYRMNVDVAKYWVDDLEDDDHDPVQVQLYQKVEGEWEAYGHPVTLKAANEWYYIWENLPEGEYKVDEVNVPEGYFKSVEEVSDQYPEMDIDFAFDITNTVIEELSFTIQKTVELGGNGKPGANEFTFFMLPIYPDDAADYGGVEYWYNGAKLEDEGGFYVFPVTVTDDGSVSATVTMKGTENALYYSDVLIREYIPSDLAAEWSYDEHIYYTYAWDYDEQSGTYGDLYLEFYEATEDEDGYHITNDDARVDEIAFVNTYTKNVPVTPPAGGDDIVKTGDGRTPALWALLSVFAAGSLGLTAVIRRKKTQK